MTFGGPPREFGEGWPRWTEVFWYVIALAIGLYLYGHH